MFCVFLSLLLSIFQIKGKQQIKKQQKIEHIVCIPSTKYKMAAASSCQQTPRNLKVQCTGNKIVRVKYATGCALLLLSLSLAGHDD